MTDARPIIAPIEGHYAELRNGIIELIGPAYLSGTQVMFKSVHFNFKWFASGKTVWDDGQYDIVALIAPEAMRKAAALPVYHFQAIEPDDVDRLWAQNVEKQLASEPLKDQGLD